MREAQVSFFFVRRADRVEEAREHVTNIAMTDVINSYNRMNLYIYELYIKAQIPRIESPGGRWITALWYIRSCIPACSTARNFMRLGTGLQIYWCIHILLEFILFILSLRS